MRKDKRHSQSQLRGTLVAYNFRPKGRIEGATIDTPNGLAQLNFPKHAAERRARAMAVGSMVVLPVQLEHDGSDHPVYIPNEHDDGASGTILRLNYALNGEVNGHHLDDGNVHPKAVRAAARNKITATSSRRRGADATVLDTKAVNDGRARKSRTSENGRLT